jgi:hypothetical protein
MATVEYKHNPNTGLVERVETKSAADVADVGSASRSTAGSGLGSLGSRVKKRKPMPMLADFNGDRKAFDAAVSEWQRAREEDTQAQGQTKAMREMQ